MLFKDVKFDFDFDGTICFFVINLPVDAYVARYYLDFILILLVDCNP